MLGGAERRSSGKRDFEEAWTTRVLLIYLTLNLVTLNCYRKSQMPVNLTPFYSDPIHDRHLPIDWTFSVSLRSPLQPNFGIYYKSKIYLP